MIPPTTFTLKDGRQSDTNSPNVDTAYLDAPSNLHPVDWTEIFKDFGDESAESAFQRILNSGIPVSCYDVDGKTALHLAAKHKNLTLAKFLIEQGADVNAPRKWPTAAAFEKRPAKPSWLWTPLHYATKKDDGDMIQLLIDAGANKEIKSSRRETALNVAYRERTVVALWLLHQHGAKRNETLHTPAVNDPLPTWLTNRMQQGNEPSLVITQLEKDILQTVTQSIGRFQAHGKRYCGRCRANFNLDSAMKNPSAHTFGYIKRCGVCTASLFTAPGVVIPSPTLLDTTPSIFQTKTPEEDLEFILAAAKKTPDQSAGSDVAFTFAKYWLLRCLKSHSSCKGLSEEIPELPTRVIDVGLGDCPPCPVLYEPEAGERGYYCTLSYRWLSFGVKTTKSSLPYFKKSLYWTLLPMVIKDAIKITIQLGLRYLWVDAYCIVQDDRDEWERESQRMREIYRNGLLTISVVGPTSREEGIFQPRNGQRIRKRPQRRPHGVLDTRGWTMQEQYLSPRLLSYAGGQLFWDCLHLSASESCPAGVPPRIDYDHRDEDFRTSRALLIKSDHETDSRDRVYWLWRKLLGAYTRRELTLEADRLAAIRGITSSFSKRLDDLLVAGIWKKTLIRHLAWWVKPERRNLNRRIERRNLNRPTEQRSLNRRDDCVSWSWLSVKHAVTYECILSYQTNVVAQRLQIDDFGDQATLVDVSAVDEIWQSAYSTGYLLLSGYLSKVFSFKTTTGSYLIPEGYMHELESKVREARYEAVVRWILEQYPPPHNRGCEIWYPDCETGLSDVEELFTFALGTSSTRHVYSLVLRQIPGATSNSFTRVGLCAWNHGNATYLHDHNFLRSIDTVALY